MISANDPRLESWVPVPPGSDFPIQNLPFGIFKPHRGTPRAGCAIGDHVVDLAFLLGAGFLTDIDLPNDVFSQSSLNAFLALGRRRIREVRGRLSGLLRHDNETLQSLGDAFLFPKEEVHLLLPVTPGDYTDFYSSETHAHNVGTMFRDAKNALLANWKHLPVGYHGRASSIVPSGTPVRRPWGQIAPEGRSPELKPSERLDFELELAFVTCGGNPLGESIPVEKTDDYIAGLVLFNDWSARDIQQWEYVPLGPFLGKSFASTISPWLVTLDALEPFRVEGPVQQPAPLSYLTTTGPRNFDIDLEVTLQPAGGQPHTICRTNARHLYWNIHQQLAHQTVNGCNIRPGDLYASGTISGSTPDAFGSLLELAWNGQKPLRLPDGSVRSFLADGDTVTFRGHARRGEVPIGFGLCSGEVQAALPITKRG